MSTVPLARAAAGDMRLDGNDALLRQSWCRRPRSRANRRATWRAVDGDDEGSKLPP